MNIFIVVRLSLCTEGSLESTLHDASRVVMALLCSFRRAISKADDRSHTTSRQFDAATASAGDSTRFIAITASAHGRKIKKSQTTLLRLRCARQIWIFKRFQIFYSLICICSSLSLQIFFAVAYRQLPVNLVKNEWI